MDTTDKKILEFLQENDKLQYQKIAKKLGIAASTVHFRVKKMVKSSIIDRFSAILDPDKFGYTTSWIGISVDPRKMEEVAKKLTSFDEIQVISTASGDHDILIQTVTKSEKELWHFINEKIKTMDGIEKDFDVSCFLDVYKRTHTIRL